MKELTTVIKKYYPEILIGLLFLLYVIIRAIVVPITIDEAQTCIVYSKMSVHDIVTYALPIPNNHILNTLLIKFFSAVLGMHTFTVRLPNVIGFVIYFFAMVMMMRDVYPHALLLRLAGIALLTCNPYFIDFFSLARGYALSCAFIVIAVWLALRFVNTRTISYLSLSATAACISVYANFTALNFYVALIGLLFLAAWFQKPFSRIRSIKASVALISVTVFLAALSYLPITKMIATKQFVFWGSESFYHNSVKSMVTASLRYAKWYHEFPVDWFAIGFIVLVIVTLIILIFRLRNNFNVLITPVFLYALLIGSIAINVLQFYIAHTPYLDERTSLSFYVMTGLALASFGKVWETIRLSFIKVWFTPIIIFATLHFLSAANFKRTYQWWFNENDEQVLAYIETAHQQSQQPITLNCNWLFHPSLNFNIQAEELNWITLVPFHSDLQVNSATDYYYTVTEEVNSLLKDYTIVESYSDARFLLKKK